MFAIGSVPMDVMEDMEDRKMMRNEAKKGKEKED